MFMKLQNITIRKKIITIYPPLTFPLNATPPRFLVELKGDTWRTMVSDLTTSNFIPS